MRSAGQLRISPPLSPVFWQGKVQSAESGPAQERRRHQRSAFLTTKSLYPTRIYRQDVSHHARTNDHATTRCTKQNASSTIPSFHSNSHRKDGTVALHGASWRAKSKNSSQHNQVRKAHRNGIKKPKTNKYPSLRGVDPKFVRNQRYAKHGTEKALKAARAEA
ncbi:ribosomal protein L29 [Moesziomyces antarcticus]|uniref:ribosomal protein L29 n=1 Tax=Pseudozyma antarctica TaxID=84753 RepID=UPI00071960CF|nr:ribosomal protein L29 [Moesziomyces antarcticus]GAK63328.1 ribosomal protein L29 [Moesziomyces antarcticus]